MNPLVSICITNYNNEKYIEKAIQSALAQDYATFEVVLVDDGSTDNSLEIIKKYGNSIKLVCQENQGTAEARNTCIKNCSPESVAYQMLDGDDWLESNCLIERVNVHIKQPKIGIIYSDFLTYDGDQNNFIQEYRPHFDVLDNLNEYILGTNIYLSCKAVENVGLYDSSFSIIEDFHMSVKVSRHFYCHHISKNHYCYRKHLTQKTELALKNNINKLNQEYQLLNEYKRKIFGIK